MLHSWCYALDVLFIVTKSSLFTVGRLCDKTIDSLGAYIHIENANICWGKSLKYLGIYFQKNATKHTEVYAVFCRDTRRRASLNSGK